jgi:hypothetical protein
MHTLPAQETQSWFLAKAAVALSPMLSLWAAGVIGWVLRRTLWRRSGVGPQSGDHPRDELAEARRSSHSPSAAIKAR